MNQMCIDELLFNTLKLLFFAIKSRQGKSFNPVLLYIRSFFLSITQSQVSTNTNQRQIHSMTSDIMKSNMEQLFDNAIFMQIGAFPQHALFKVRLAHDDICCQVHQESITSRTAAAVRLKALLAEVFFPTAYIH